MNNLMHIRRLILLGFAVIYLVNSFVALSVLTITNYLFLLVIILWALPELPRTNLWVSLGLFLIGAINLLIIKAPLHQYFQALARNSGLVTLFIAVPLIGLPFFYDNYQEELKNVTLKHMSNNLWGFGLLTAIAVHISGVFLLVGGIISVYELLRENAKLYRNEKFFIASLLRGYMATGFWSPAWASMAVVTVYLHFSWIELIPAGIFLAVFFMALGLLISIMGIRRLPGNGVWLEPNAQAIVNWKKIYTMAALLLGPAIIILFVDLLTAWKLMVIIPIVASVYPLLTAVFLKKLPQLKAGLANYYNTTIFKGKNEAVLFTAAGFLGASLEMGGIDKIIPQLLPAWIIQYPFLVITFLIGVMAIISLPGIHPVVSGSALVSAINPLTVGLTPYAFALTILGGWAVAIMVSPFSACNMVASSLTGIPSWDIGLKLNGFYGLICTLLLALIITTLFM